MMINNTIKFPKRPAIFDERKFIMRFENASIKAAGLATRVIESEIKSSMSSSTGKTKRSVTSDVVSRRGGQQVIGIVGSPEKVAIFLEEGTRPHWAPLAPLAYWARRKFGNPTFGHYVRRKIAGVIPGARGGTPAFEYFAKAFARMGNRALAIYRDSFRQLTKDLTR